MHKAFQDELTLLQGINERKKDAIKILHGRTIQRVVYFSFKIVNNRQIAEEIASDAFVKTITNNLRFDSYKQVESCLFAATKNLSLNHLNSPENKTDQSLTNEIPEISEDYNMEAYLIQTELIFELYKQVEKLPQKAKMIFMLHLNGLTIPEIAHRLNASDRYISRTKSRIIKWLQETFKKKDMLTHSDTIEKLEKLIDPIHDTTEIAKDIITPIRINEDEINAALINHLQKHPHQLYHMDPYKFEVLVAALMKDMGYNVFHTSRSRDGGMDIIAVMKTLSNDDFVTIVECKRNGISHKVGIDVVERFLYTIRDKKKANAGWIVTTSSFSGEARKCQHDYKWLLSLKDNKDLQAWCSNYGQWKRSGESGGLWLPNNPLL